VPLTHAPGEAQANFGEALVVIAGVERKAHYLAVDFRTPTTALESRFRRRRRRRFWKATYAPLLTSKPEAPNTAARKYAGLVPQR
jgi:hypothetical protein